MSVWDYLADRDAPGRRKMIAELRSALRSQLENGMRIIDSPSARQLYSRDLADMPGWMEKALFRTTPDVVVQPASPQQIAQALKFAAQRKLPVVPRGVASTAFGGPVPTSAGMVIDLSPMNKISDISTGDVATVAVQAGARFGDVEERAEALGYTLAVYPSNRLGTVGGWLSSGGYGVNALKYGHISQWADAIEVVTMDGKIRWLENGEKEFDRFVGTEGQMGIISSVSLRLLPQPALRSPHLLSFGSAKAALSFAKQLYSHGAIPATIMFMAAELLRLLNDLHRQDHGGTERYLPERPSLLVYCDDKEAESRLKAALEGRTDIIEAGRERSGHAWADRFFPMKIRRMGPSLLAGQVILPIERTAIFLEEAARLAAEWSVELATEAHVLQPETAGGPLRTLVTLMFLTDQRQRAYVGHTMFVAMLDRLGGKFHGKPYNLGLWHAPFAGEKYSKRQLEELRGAKKHLDPQGLMNPGKFLSEQSGRPSLSQVVFKPRIFKSGMDAAKLATPLIAPIAGKSDGARVKRPATNGHDPRFYVSPVPARIAGDPSADLLLTATQCTSCGNCVSVCPAYLHTKDERTTARGKLWLARRVAAGKPFDHDEAALAFLCMRCRSCSEVCQAQLPLMDAWEQLEHLLTPRFGRPNGDISRFLAGIERNPAYGEFMGLTRPGGLLSQSWLKEPDEEAEAQPVTPAMEELPGQEDRWYGGKFHIHTNPAPGKARPVGKFSIERSEFCVNCGHCGEACIYGVHHRQPEDPRRMAAPDDHVCRACFRCVTECPRQALTISVDETFSQWGHGPYTPDVVLSLARQADEGRVPVTGAGYRGPFAGEGFDGMWTDMSEIVRPTRDGIHGREYISTSIDLGRRPRQLVFDSSGKLAEEVPPSLELPIPVLFARPHIHRRDSHVLMAIRRAATQLNTYVLGDTSPTDGLAEVEDAPDVMDVVSRIKRTHPRTVVVVKLPLGSNAPERVEELVRAGAEVIHLQAGWDGTCADGTKLHESLPLVHQRLVAADIRDAVTLLASGGIAAAEHVPKAIILGADGVVVDLPLLAALECPLGDECFSGGQCQAQLDKMDVRWGQQRIVNLMAAWRNQLLEVMGAMGMREVRRLRGERGRAMFARKLEDDLFAPLFRKATMEITL